VKPAHALLIPAVMSLVSGCATEPVALNLWVGENPAPARTWPTAPEVPRYRYAGQLVGELNFRGEKAASRGTRFLRWLAGMEPKRDGAAGLLRPQGGMVDAAGRIYVTDVGQRAVFVFDPVQGLKIWESADRGAHFVNPLGIAQGPGGEVRVCDAELARVVRLDAQGNPLGSFGEGILRRPTGLVRDEQAGLTYVADTGAHDIKVFDDAGALVRTLGSRGTAPGQFNAPTYLALDGHRIVVSDTLNARVQILSPSGEPEAVVGERGLYVGNLTRPKGVAVDADGNVYVAESYYDYILVYDRQGQLLLPIGGTGREPGRFFLPGGIWSDAADRIFVADVMNARVVIFQYLGD
jgi:DNA-binding beta-propeller fold protein YncE